MPDPDTPDRFKPLLGRAAELGAAGSKVVNADDVAVADWVRLKCQYGCGGYGRRLTCPPYSPTPTQTRAILKEYSLGILLMFDGEEPNVHDTVAKLETQAFLAGFYKAFGMAAGPCPFCDRCNFQGCVHPYKARPSMEACGIDVYATARRAGFKIDVVKSRKEQPTYYGLVLIE